MNRLLSALLLCGVLSCAHAEEKTASAPEGTAPQGETGNVGSNTSNTDNTVASDGKWHIGGAIRWRYTDMDYPKRHAKDYHDNYGGIDTARIDISYDSSTWFGAFQYRFYGHYYPYKYENDFGDINFPAFAWVGYKFDPNNSVVAGLNQIPFGALPYVGTTFYQSLFNVGGLEDVHNLGVKYEYKADRINLQAGFYPRDGGNWAGTSYDSDRYSVNVVKNGPGGQNNHERNQLVGRFAYTLPHDKDSRSEFGVSGLYSQLHNYDTDRNGDRRAFALHYVGQYGPVGVFAQWARQVMDTKNPGGRPANKALSFGAFDGSFNVANRGNLYAAEVNYLVPWSTTWLSSIKPYLNYSAFDKDSSQFKTSERVLAGVQFANGPFYSYIEMRWGRNDPYTGDYTNGLASGGDDLWKRALYVNVGYYF